MKNLLICLVFFGFANTARAAIVCEGTTSDIQMKVKVTITDKTVTVTSEALSKPEVFTKLSGVYDGHETVLITAPGLAITYKNEYGCIREANITANMRDSLDLIDTVSVGTCSGGSTSDGICHPTR